MPGSSHTPSRGSDAGRSAPTDATPAPDASGIRILKREADRVRRTRLVRALDSVVADAQRRFRDLDLAILATNAEGSIVAARGCGKQTTAWMVAAGLSVGAEGGGASPAGDLLGAVLETGREVAIASGESDHLLGGRTWVAAGVPIVDPKVRRTIGAFALLHRSAPSTPLLSANARDLAIQVGERLDDDAQESDRAVMEAFLRRRRRRCLGVVGIGRHLIVADRQAHEAIADADHAEVWEQAKRALADATEPITISDQQVIRSAEPVTDPRGDGGVVFEIADEAPRGPRVRAPRTEETLDGLVGRSASWLALVREVCSLRHQTHPALISGERGSGKASVAVAIATRAGAEGCVAHLDCAEPLVIGLPVWLRQVGDELRRPGCTIVLRHLDLLDEAGAAALRAVLDGEEMRSTRVLATIDGTAEIRGALGALTAELGVGRIEVPPLRLRCEDVAPLATAIVYRHASRGYVPRLRRDTLALMRRYDWPGNVRELDSTIQSALGRRLVGDLRPEDLPLEIQSGRDIMLTTLQQREKEVILAALRDNNNNKVAAANALGLARSTLYRKIEAYDIEAEAA